MSGGLDYTQDEAKALGTNEPNLNREKKRPWAEECREEIRPELNGRGGCSAGSGGGKVTS